MLLNSIRVPSRFVAVCHHWHGGQNCMLYAISSTGGLTTGTLRQDRSDEEWHLDLFLDLGATLTGLVKWCKEHNDDDYEILNKFLEWTNDQCEAIEAEGIQILDQKIA
jgi:hypothetical protein